MKIGFFELDGWEEKMIREKFQGHDLRFSNEKINEKNLPAQLDFDIICTFVSSQVTSGVIDKFPNLKLISTRSTGFDHIDVPTCNAKGIKVSYVPGYGDNTVAEFAFSLILNLTRKMYQAIDQIKKSETFSFAGLKGMDIKGKTLLVIGTGRIGKESIKIAKGFSMNVVAYDPFPNEEASKTLGFTYMPLEEALKIADVITIHAPLTDKTKHLINKDNIKFIKKGAYLVNTARGGIVETSALVTALMDGTLAGAGLDVLEEEGDIKDEMKFLANTEFHEERVRVMLENHALMKMSNVLITPHNAFNTQEALERILNTTIDNISGFLANTPKNLVP